MESANEFRFQKDSLLQRLEVRMKTFSGQQLILTEGFSETRAETCTDLFSSLNQINL